MENTRTRHPALAFLVSLSVAGTCLAAPGLALAAPSATGADEPAGATAAESAAAETAEPSQTTDEAAISNPDLKGAEEAAQDADKAADAERAKVDGDAADANDSAAPTDKGAIDTKDIKVDSGSITFGGVTVAVPDSFLVMDFPHLMTIAVAPTGDMSVTLASPSMLMDDGTSSEVGPELFDAIAASLAEGAGIETPKAQELALSDDTEAYEYVFDLVDPESGEPVASNAAVYMVFVPVGDSYTVVQVTVDRLVADVSQETVDSIVSSITVGAADAAAPSDAAKADKGAKADKADEADKADKADEADAAKPDEGAEPETGVDEAAISNPELKGAEEAAADADKAADAERAKVDDAAKAEEDGAAAADETKADADKADGATDVADTDKAADADATADPAEDVAVAGATESFAGMSFVVPEGFSTTDEASDQQGVWADESGNLVIRVTPDAVDDVSSMTLRDLTREAYGLAASLDGEIVGYASFENDDATVYAYAIVFERDGVELLGYVGYVPVADGSLSVISCAFPLADADLYGPTAEGVLESVSVVE